MSMNDTSHLVDGKYGICDLVDLSELRRIFERFTEATGFTIGFLDHPGLNVLVATGWREICTKFHRSCPLAEANCLRSNHHLLDHLDTPGQMMIEPCDNGLVDCAYPIIVKGKHIASLATGQLLLKQPDFERFRGQAQLFEVDEHAYLQALAEVPVVSENKLRSMTQFLGEMALVLSEVGYARLAIKEDAERLGNEVAIRQQAEAQIRHLNDVLCAIRTIDQLIHHEKDPHRLLQAACQSLLQTRGYIAVWAGHPEPESKLVTMVAHAGVGDAFFQSHAPITWDDAPTGRGPTGTAIRERRPVVVDDLATDPCFAPWCKSAMATGAASIASVPLLHGDRLFGALTVKANRVRAFDAEELRLLSSLASDLALALQSIENDRHRQQAESALARTHRALRVLTEGNRALVRATDEQEFLKAACRIVVAVGGYRMAWIGYAEHDTGKTVRPMARAGFAKDLFRHMTVSWANTKFGRGPTGRAIRSGRPCVCRDISKDPLVAPWRKAALERGYASLLALPLMAEQRCLGSLTVYAAQTDVFGDTEVQLLEQLAIDLAFGIIALRNRADRNRLEQQVLEVSEREQRRIGNDLHDSLGQQLAAMRMMSSTLANNLAEQKLPGATDAARIESELQHSLEEMRKIIHGLHPIQATPQSLMSALYGLAASVTQRIKLPCRFECPGVAVNDHHAATHLFRIAQEAVNNAIRHGRAKHIVIRLRRINDHIRLSITDDGCGLPVASNRVEGLGLRIMGYRASVIGATFAATRRRNGGTQITCDWNPRAPKKNAP